MGFLLASVSSARLTCVSSCCAFGRALELELNHRMLMSLCLVLLVIFSYSTRELVNIVRHMSAYPADSMEKVLANVLSFDSFDENLLVKLKETFATHGLL